MSIEMAVWRMTEGGPVRLESSPLSLEQRLEDMILKDPSLVGLDVLVIGRQVPTAHGGWIDILAVDAESRVHVLELKRDRTPRDVVAQALDYGSWTYNLSLEEVASLYAEQQEEGSFEDAFAERFNQPLPDVFNPDQQLTIVASELDAVSDRIVEYLAERFGVPINAVFFRHFHDQGADYLARTWLLAPEDTATRRPKTKVRPWNGRDFYVVLGNLQQGLVRWEIAERFGVVNAGGGSWFWKPLRNLGPGKRVFAYVGGAGYTGVGEVTGSMMLARDAVVSVDGQRVPLLEAPGVPNSFVERANVQDEEETEYVVPVRWTKTRPVDDAIREQGLFSSQVTVCKLRDARTIEKVEKAFGIEPGS